MTRLGLVLALLFAFFAPAVGRAEAVRSTHMTAELVSETDGVAPGSTAWFAVVLTHENGWHSYWRNPGDAGEATTIAWALPAGWRAGPIVWPAPARLPLGPIMNYGFVGRAILAAPIEIPAAAPVGGSQRLTAKVDYLVCADVCVPGTAIVTLTTPVVAGAPPLDPTWGATIEAALAAAPKPGGLDARFERAGGALRIAVAGAALEGTKGLAAYFYPFDDTSIDQSKPERVERGRRGLTFTLVPGAAFAGGAKPSILAGVVEADGRAYEADASAGLPPAGAAGLGSPAREAARPFLLDLAIEGGLAFLGGLILNLMPCVFPILSMKAAALARGGSAPGEARADAAAFLVGVLTTFIALAGVLIGLRAGGAAVGWGFQLQSPLVVSLLALVIFAAGLNLSGLFEVGASLQGLAAGEATRGGLIGAFLTGVLAVVVAAPCTAPFMGPALGWAVTQEAPAALVVFAALALGFAAPFVVFSFSPALIGLLPKPGSWMEILRRTLAFPLYASVAWLVWVGAQQTGPAGLGRLLAALVALAAAASLFGGAQRRRAAMGGGGPMTAAAAAGLILAIAVVAAGRFDPPTRGGAAPTVTAALPSEVYSPERLAALRARGATVLVNLTAAWCVTCQVNERVALSSPVVSAALKRDGAVYLVGDWTNRNAAVAAALAAQGRIGVPLYLVYGAGGGEPDVLPQLLTPAMVAGALDRAAVRPRAVAVR